MNEETEITTTFIDTDPTYNDELQEIISQLDKIVVEQSKAVSSVNDISILYADYQKTDSEFMLFIIAFVVFIVGAVGTVCWLLISHFFKGR